MLRRTKEAWGHRHRDRLPDAGRPRSRTWPHSGLGPDRGRRRPPDRARPGQPEHLARQRLRSRTSPRPGRHPPPAHPCRTRLRQHPRPDLPLPELRPGGHLLRPRPLPAGTARRQRQPHQSGSGLRAPPRPAPRTRNRARHHAQSPALLGRTRWPLVLHPQLGPAQPDPPRPRHDLRIAADQSVRAPHRARSRPSVDLAHVTGGPRPAIEPVAAIHCTRTMQPCTRCREWQQGRYADTTDSAGANGCAGVAPVAGRASSRTRAAASNAATAHAGHSRLGAWS